MKILYYPFILQGGIMLIDEFYFHNKRNLPTWERIGHPLDSFFVILCYVFLLTNTYTQENLSRYIGLSVFSSLFVTKDEWIHTKSCSGNENWLHALLFILHPVTFLCAGIIWMNQSDSLFFIIQPLIIFFFMLYQIIRWSVYANK